jgi:hypothetical protein
MLWHGIGGVIGTPAWFWLRLAALGFWPMATNFGWVFEKPPFFQSLQDIHG